MSAGKYVDCMIKRHDRSLNTLERVAYIEATEVAMTTTKPLDFCDLHCVLMSADLTAGLYRERIVLDKHLFVERPFPRPTAIRRLLFTVKQDYQEMLELEETTLDDTALQLKLWCIAAQIRCIRPFDRGTLRLSYLLLGQMRAQLGFDFLCDEFSIESYHKYRNQYQREHSQFYGKREGAI